MSQGSSQRTSTRASASSLMKASPLRSTSSTTSPMSPVSVTQTHRWLSILPLSDHGIAESPPHQQSAHQPRSDLLDVNRRRLQHQPPHHPLIMPPQLMWHRHRYGCVDISIPHLAVKSWPVNARWLTGTQQQQRKRNNLTVSFAGLESWSADPDGLEHSQRSRVMPHPGSTLTPRVAAITPLSNVHHPAVGRPMTPDGV